MTETPAADAAGQPVLSGRSRLVRGLGYLLAGLPVGIAALVVAVAGFATGVSTLVVWIGLPILVGTLRAARGLAAVERRAVHWATGRELPPHHYRPARRLLYTLADPQSWRDLLHCVVAFPVRVATFSIAVSWTAGGLGLTLYVLWAWSLPHSDGDYHGLYGLITGSSGQLGDVVLNTVIGVFLLLTLPWVVRALVAARVGLVRGLLTNQTAALRARADQLAAVGDGDALVEAVLAQQVDVAVVDVRMPPSFTDEGLRAALEIRRRVPRIGILVLSQYVEESYACDLLAAGGGVGYLLKDRVSKLADLSDALTRVAAGGTVLDPEVVAALLAHRHRRDPLGALSPREREVLGLMAEGRTNTAIGRTLVITPGAVEKHISSIFGKLGLAPSGDDHRRVLAVLTWLGA